MRHKKHFSRSLKWAALRQEILEGIALGSLFIACGLAWYVPVREAFLAIPYERFVKVNRSHIAIALDRTLHMNEFPELLSLRTWAGMQTVLPQYTLDTEAQERVERTLRAYGPDYAAFVALDATTGRILTMVSFTRYPATFGNLATKAIFPAASVFKIVTATAAIDARRFSPESVISFRGANHTLFKRNLTEAEGRTWGSRYMTLKEAFGKSVNMVFGKIGAFVLTPEDLDEYARRFLFNQPLGADLPVQRGRFAIPEKDSWVLAELASGFNRINLLSPLQGAMMAAAIAHDGVMQAPFVVDNLRNDSGEVIYRGQPQTLSVVMSQESAEQMRTLMRETVRTGTSRKSFRTFLMRPMAQEIDVGGKTGSLTGENPRGKCDWFVGYGRRGSQRIAIAALTVNEEQWRVKASQLAREYLENYFEERKGTENRNSATLAPPPVTRAQ